VPISTSAVVAKPTVAFDEPVTEKEAIAVRSRRIEI
jgi:hypothetical protein